MKATEHQEQCAVIDWFRAQYPAHAKKLFAIPNGAHLAGDPVARAIKMGRMKKEGLRPGVSDLFLMKAKKGCHGLWIEMKAEKGRPSDEQLAFRMDAIAEGFACVICYGANMAIAAIKEYME